MSDAADPDEFNDAEIAEHIALIARSKTHLPVMPQSTLDDLGLDSLATAEMVFEIEKTFHIRTDDSILEVHTLPELVQYVRHRVRG